MNELGNIGDGDIQDGLDMSIVMDAADIDKKVDQERAKSRRVIGCCIFLVLIICVVVIGFVIFRVIVSARDVGMRAPTESPTSSLSPTPAPTTDFEDLDFELEVLPEYTKLQLKTTPKTPQSLALEWLQKDPQYNTYSNSRKVVRFVLAALYYSTSGDSWKRYDQTNWLQYDSHECDWKFRGRDPCDITCAGYGTEAEAEVSPTTRTIYCIDLNNYDLKGTIPPEIVLLTNLKELNLQQTGLQGTIPGTLIKNISGLYRLILNGNALSGQIPTGFLNSRLHQMDLQDNQLTGTLPNELKYLENIEFINLSNNALHGTVPKQIGIDDSLKELDLSSNKLSGQFPILESLRRLNIRDNQFSGPIFWSITPITKSTHEDTITTTRDEQRQTMLTNIELVILDNNYFTGSIPEQLYEDAGKNFASLSFGNNFIAGTVPDMQDAVVSPTIARLTYDFIFTKNNFVGYNPIESIEYYGNVRYLRLDNNEFTGSIPDSFFVITVGVEEIILNSNRISGSLPVEIGEVGGTLKKLHLQNNQITGTIPTTIGNLKKVESIQLHSNLFIGSSIPSEIGNCESLRSLYLFNNQFNNNSIPQPQSNIDNNSNNTSKNETTVQNKIQIPIEICQLKLLEKIIVDCSRIDCSVCNDNTGNDNDDVCECIEDETLLPPNDKYTNATIVTEYNKAYKGSTLHATADTSNIINPSVVSSCEEKSIHFSSISSIAITTNAPFSLLQPPKGVWYKVIGTGNALKATTCTDNNGFFNSRLVNYVSLMDTRISIFIRKGEESNNNNDNNNNDNGFECVTGNDDVPLSYVRQENQEKKKMETACANTFQSQITWDTTVNTIYYIYVHGSSSNEIGYFHLTVTN